MTTSNKSCFSVKIRLDVKDHVSHHGTFSPHCSLTCSMVPRQGCLVMAPALILHVEFVFVSREVLDVRKCLSFARLVMVGSVLQEHKDITVIHDGHGWVEGGGGGGGRELGIVLVLGCIVGTASKEVPSRGFHQCIHHGGSSRHLVGVIVGLRVGFSPFNRE